MELVVEEVVQVVVVKALTLAKVVVVFA